METYKVDIDHRNEVMTPFVLREEDITRIHERFDAVFDEVSIVCGCVDKTRREFSSIEELLLYQNINDKRIVRLSISGSYRKDGKRSSAEIEWNAGMHYKSPAFFLPSVRITINSDDEKVVDLFKSDFDANIVSIRPWYHWIARFDADSLVNFSALALLLIPLIWFIPKTLDIISGSSVSAVFPNEIKEVPSYSEVDALAWVTLLFIFSIITVVLFVRFLVLKPKRIIFPAFVFLIGVEKAVHRNREIARITIVTAGVPAIFAVVYNALNFMM